MTWGSKRLFAVLAPLLVAAGLHATTSSASAVAYSGYSDWRTISAGGSQTCAIRTTGQLYCWSTDGGGSTGFPLSGYRDWKSVSVGESHQCAIRGSGYLYCWGNDADGRVGNGSLGSPSTPARIGAATDWKSVTAGASHTCGIRSAGLLACWGSDGDGQLGNGSSATGDASVPVRVGTAEGWKSVTAGGAHTCAIWGNNTLYCWGSDTSGQVGNGGASSEDVSSPTRISSASWNSVSAGGSHTCAIRGDGLLGCWGSDSSGQLGNAGGDQPAPIRTTSVTDWQRISAGADHSCAYRGTGTLYCWGSNSKRQTVESSDTSAFDTPQRYVGIYDWRSTDAGAEHTCAIRATGRIYCWGDQQPPSSGTPAGTAYPTDVLDLRRWKLTIPFDGCDDNTVADEIKWGGGLCIPDFATYRSLSYFHSTSDNKAVVFRTPVGGAKTGGSVFARTELREQTLLNPTTGKNGTCNWSNQSGTHTMRITHKVTHLPPKIPKVVVGQIHDPRDEVVMVRVNGSTIIAEASYPDPAYEDGRKVPITVKTGYQLGTYFTIRITASASGVAVFYNEGKSDAKTASFPGRVARNASPDKTTGDGWYFKAGHYLQTNTAKGEAPNEFGEAVLSSLSISHSNSVCG